MPELPERAIKYRARGGYRMLHYLFALVAEVPAPPEPVQRAFWEIVLQGMGATLLVAAFLGLVWKFVVKHHVDGYVKQLTDIHHTTTVNGNSADPKTLRDKIERLGGQVETLTSNVAAIAVNQASHSADPDAHRKSS